MLTLSHVTGGWQFYTFALLLKFLWTFFLCVCSAGYLMGIECIHLVDTIQIIVTKYKNLTTFSNLTVGHWKPVVLGVSVNTHSLSEAWTVMLKQPSKSHVKYFFNVQLNCWKHSDVYRLFVHEKVVRRQQNVFRSFVWSSKWRAKFPQTLLTDLSS